MFVIRHASTYVSSVPRSASRHSRSDASTKAMRLSSPVSGIGALGVAQALAEAAKIGAPLDALPLVGEEAPGHGEQFEVRLREDVGAGREGANGEGSGPGARLERQREIGADRQALESGCGSSRPSPPAFAPAASGNVPPACNSEAATPRTSMRRSSASSQSTRPSSTEPGGSSASSKSRTVSAASEKLVNRRSARRASELRAVPLTSYLSAPSTKA